MMSLMTVLNASVGSTEVLVVTGVGLLLGINKARARIVVGYGAKKIETVDLTSKEEEILVVSALSTVGAGTGTDSGVDVVLLLKFMKT